MIDDILSQQYVDGRPYSSPMIDRFGHRSVIYDPRKSFQTSETLTPPPLQNVEKNVAARVQFSQKPSYAAQNAEKTVERKSKINPAVPPPSRPAPHKPVYRDSTEQKPAAIPVGYALLILSILLFAFLALTWWTKYSADEEFLMPGPDESLRDELAAYAGLAPNEDYVDENFPLEITGIFSISPYTVQRGDTVSQLAETNKVSMDSIIALNNITNARLLPVGKVLKIPNMDGLPYIMKSTDTYQKIADAYKTPLAVILDANNIQNEVINAGDMIFIPGARMKREDLKLALGDYFLWPLKEHKITSPYGWRIDPFTGIGGRVHEGIDLSAKAGTPVRAAMDGKVVMLGSNTIYGKYIIISHANNLKTLYGHLSAYSVKIGAYVTQGAKIGESGGTGHVTGAHLHFGVYKNDKSANPLDYLAK